MNYREDVLIHEGVAHDENPPGRGSGRYGWGTGKNPHQHQFNLQSEVSRMRKAGFTNAEIAKALFGPNATTTTLKMEIALAEKTERKIKTETAFKYLEQANGNKLQAAKAMGVPPSSFYKLVDPGYIDRNDTYFKTAEFIKNKIDKEGRPVNVSGGVEYDLNVTRDTMKNAIYLLEKEGYVKAYALVPQQGTIDKKTTITVLCPPGTDVNVKLDSNGKEKAWASWRQTGIASIVEYSPDEGKTFFVPEYPASLDSKRVFIQYGDQGGSQKDGVIEIRKGVKDLSLGNSNYAQVRIMVDGDHYMKGMAIYSDNVPEGYDIIYNTNKKTGASYEKVFKGCKVSCPPETIAKQMGISEKEARDGLKKGSINAETVDDLKTLGIKNPNQYIDKDNPFGANIKAGGQYRYEDSSGKKQLSPVNKLTEEGDWDTWGKNLSAQFLSKQPLKTINSMLNLSIANRQDELNQIKELTNPVIKKNLLEQFAKNCDSNAADLSSTGFRKQAFQVILPITTLKDNECYSQRYKDGEQIALVRYPHAGTFEVAIVTNNTKHKDSKSILGSASDAIGINSNVAARLSGADFDGDTVLCIPMTTNRVSIKSTPQVGPLASLRDFDPKMYKVSDDKKTITNSMKQRQMGEVTNLIADMTLGGAPNDQVVRAVKHSMVVIDSQKHNLDWKRSAEENGIRDLKANWQGVNERGQVKGASTILTRARGKVYINQRKEVNDVTKMTPEEVKRYRNGEIIYRETGNTKTDYKTGKQTVKQMKVSQMDTVTNAFDLVRDPSNLKEVAYANYANSLKSIANEARKEARSIRAYKVSTEAKKTYAAEVVSLNEKLKNAERNRPREQKAQELASFIVSEKFKSNPDMDWEHKQRERARAINLTRSIVGAKKDQIEITDREWEAIQANAISTNKLTKILANTNQDKFKQRATPRRSSNSSLSTSQINKAKAMYASGMYTLAEIAEALGFSTSTISKAVKS